MQKGLLIWVLILLGSCAGSRDFKNISLTNKFVSYNKVKVKINLGGFDSFSLKGNINVIRDSMVCFSLWGPLGMKVISGQYGDHFKVIDHYNGKEFQDVMEKLMQKSGIVFNRTVIENILLAEVDSLPLILAGLNKQLLQVGSEVRGKKKFITFINKSRKSEISLEYNFNRAIPKVIRMFYRDTIDSWNVIIEIIAISNEKKKCNFG